MARLSRPYIPLETRCRVALRQLGEMWPDQYLESARLAFNTKEILDHLLYRLRELLHAEKLHLDHDPPLGARRVAFGRYIPDANDSEHLIYREKRAHEIKTNVRGEHGQHPDRVLIKKARRIERGPKPKRGPKLQGRGFSKVKPKWAKRPFERRTIR